MTTPVNKSAGATYARLHYPAVPQLSAVSVAQNSALIPLPPNVDSIMVKVTYSANDVTAPIRIIHVDHNDVETESASITPANSTNDAGGARFHGELIEVPTLGAKGYKIRVDDVPSNAGNVSTYGGYA